MPTLVPIPAWTAEGLLPPVDQSHPTSVANRAPFQVSLSDLILRFDTGAERRAILEGFLDYRAALHGIGLVSGFQWVDGSFVERLESSACNRPPNDIDIVTFFRLPADGSQQDLFGRAPELFPATASDKDILRAKFKVDAYFMDLEMQAERLVDQSAYWYGVWAHQRDSFKWKGFLQVDLAPDDDSQARLLLGSSSQGGAA